MTHQWMPTLAGEEGRSGNSLGNSRVVLGGPELSGPEPFGSGYLRQRPRRYESGPCRTAGIALPRWGSRVRIPSSAPRINCRSSASDGRDPVQVGASTAFSDPLRNAVGFGGVARL